MDIGGSGIKAAIVDTKTGELISDRHRIATPKPATPHAVAQVVKEMIQDIIYDIDAAEIKHIEVKQI